MPKKLKNDKKIAKILKGLERCLILYELHSNCQKFCTENDKREQEKLKLEREISILKKQIKNTKTEIAKCRNRTRRFKNELGERGIYA